MTADLLSTPSRIFYEHSKFRLFLSLIFGGISMIFLGFAAIDGGFAKSNQIAYSNGEVTDATQIDPYLPAGGSLAFVSAIATSDEFRDVNGILSGGYGFACFCYFSSFALALVATILISPYFGGSPNERKIINAPFEVQG